MPGRYENRYFQASVPEKAGKKVHFLFSIRQVEDIFREIGISPVPFSPPCVKGIAKWREHPVPVLCLEECLGFSIADSDYAQRLILVRGSLDLAESTRAVIKVFGALRMIALPLECTPQSHRTGFPNRIWSEGFTNGRG
ncbi:MAG: chemotaxis protein CheW, partial [Desulfobacteraceae bacterium]|nr:chemotaxis protein CheW [Desulfobacteraceae bacterium]